MIDPAIRKLNLGCGFDKRDGWINADNFPECEPDLMLDVEDADWPFEDGRFDHVLLKHVLEHVGKDFADFARIMRNLYRILSPGGILEIHVPYYRHDTYWSDPTHVRAFTPLTFRMMSKKQNDEWIAARANYTMLAHLMRVDFELVHGVQVYDPAYIAAMNEGRMSKEEVRRRAETDWGVVRELQFQLRAVK
jgi:predicted SAM-dependent methyltransferase